MPIVTKMNLILSYLVILSVHIWFPLIDVGAIPEQVWNCLICMGHVLAFTTTSSRLTSRVLSGHQPVPKQMRNS
jgi:hypothetical protein